MVNMRLPANTQKNSETGKPHSAVLQVLVMHYTKLWSHLTESKRNANAYMADQVVTIKHLFAEKI